MALWCMIARLDSKSRLPSEGGGLGLIPSRASGDYMDLYINKA